MPLMYSSWRRGEALLGNRVAEKDPRWYCLMARLYHVLPEKKHKKPFHTIKSCVSDLPVQPGDTYFTSSIVRLCVKVPASSR
jgi:hypothetical protein